LRSKNDTITLDDLVVAEDKENINYKTVDKDSINMNETGEFKF